jgi:hypothetical protein
MGEWTAMGYNASYFTADTGSDWTVASGDVVSYAWTTIGKTMTVVFQIDATDIANTPTYLKLTVPNGQTIARNAIAVIRVLDVNNGQAGFAHAVDGDQFIRLYSDLQATASGWGNTTGGAYVQGQIVFEID